MHPDVKSTFDRYPLATRSELMLLRELIYDVAAETEGVGPLEETLKWGEISYLNPAGTTLRIGTKKGTNQVALFVHCQTNIVETLRERDLGVLELEGDRCITWPDGEQMPIAEVREVIRLALTYRLT